MSSQIMSVLEELKPTSHKAINPAVLSRLWDNEKPLALARREMVANAKWSMKPRGGAESLMAPSNRSSKRKVKTLSLGAHGNLIQALNTELLGGQNYPILTTVMGALAGVASSGAGLIFSAASAGYDSYRQAHRVLARDGDEIWHVEEIGKERIGGQFQPIYISSFFIADPYRNQASSKGWLIHEERHDLSL